jgi:ribonucleotide reductase alpha subunit
MITSLPPTASTSQILGNYESFEPQNSNMFMRSTLSGDFPIINKWLVQDLVKLGIWNTEMKNQIITNSGSVQNITGIPESLKKIYKTIWEIPQKVLLEMSADRARFVDQTQSLNVYMASPTIAKLSSMHFYAWKLKLKTGMYYLRSKPASNAQQFSIQKNTTKTTIEEQLICSIDNRDACQSCSG